MNPSRLRQKLKAHRNPVSQPKRDTGVILFRAGKSQFHQGSVPVSVLNQGWPVHVSSEVLIGTSEIANVSPSLYNNCEVSIRFTEQGIKRINGLKELDNDYTLVLYINDQPVQNIALVQQVTKASEVNLPFGSSKGRDAFIEYCLASK